MNTVYLESLVFALQIASFVLVAGPVMVRNERRRTLALNRAWVASQPGFLDAHGEVSVRPFQIATAALLSLLAAAAATASRPLVFAVHTPLFVAVCLGFYVHYEMAEKRLRAMIPEDPIRKAELRPRTLRAFLPGWVLWALAAAAGAILSLNAWGYASGRIDPSRALSNGVFLGVCAAGLGALLRYTLRRGSYRLNPETDRSGRSLELSLTIGVGALFIALSFVHSLGSIGSPRWFAHPPTQLHAFIENTPWSWTTYFERTEYRWVEVGTSMFIALIGPLLARSAFTRRLLADAR